jgi:hypothetical protein
VVAGRVITNTPHLVDVHKGLLELDEMGLLELDEMGLLELDEMGLLELDEMGLLELDEMGLLELERELAIVLPVVMFPMVIYRLIMLNLITRTQSRIWHWKKMCKNLTKNLLVKYNIAQPERRLKQ